jgi:histidine kinase/DNA gyrase B/HSP90-like ATPase
VQAERILAALAALLRLGTLPLVAAALPAIGTGPHAARGTWVAVGFAVETALFGVLCLRTGVLRRSWATLDQLVVALAVVGTVWPVGSGGSVESPLFNAALVSAVVCALPAGPWWVALASAVPVAAATVGPALLAHHPSAPAWTLLPDASAAPIAALIAWPVARLERRSARDYDAHRALLVRRAELLARDRERTRQGAALRARLLGTLEDIAAARAVTDPALAHQLDVEVRWLRRVVEVGLVDPPPDLVAGLRALVAEKAATGLRVSLDLPDRLPELPDPARDALLDATREALTNVTKHAGVRAAAVHLDVAADSVAVEVVDAGRGYDPRTSRPGTGQTGSIMARLAEAGGTAEVHSTPGVGTRVLLRVPA